MRPPNSILTILQKSPLNSYTNCWEYNGRVDHKGFPTAVGLNGEYVKPARAIYQFIKGDIQPNWVVTQTCRNRRCVNPDHLNAGIQRDVSPKKCPNTPIVIFMKTKIDPETQCWEWQHSTNRGGYGFVSIEGKNRTVHRHIYKFLNPNMPEELHVLHQCDNRLCCNPEHLFTGTNLDNVQDCVSKGRQKHRHKFTDEQKRDILEARKSGMLKKDIIKKFGVSCSTVSIITQGHLTKEEIRPCKKIRVKNDTGIDLVFDSSTSASAYLGVAKGTIGNAIRRGHACKGFQVEYI